MGWRSIRPVGPWRWLSIGDGEGNTFSLKGSALTVGQWSHLAMTYDNATLKLYVDGVAAGHVSINRVRTTSPAPLVVGRGGDAAHYFKGMLDDVQLYSQALSAADIAGACRECASSPAVLTASFLAPGGWGVSIDRAVVIGRSFVSGCGFSIVLRSIADVFSRSRHDL